MFKKHPPKEEPELSAKDYFEIVKSRKQSITDEDLERVYDNCLELLNKYKIIKCRPLVI